MMYLLINSLRVILRDILGMLPIYYSEKNFKNSALLTILTKPILNESNINIYVKTPAKEVKLCETLPSYESYQIVDEEKKSLSQNIETYLLNNVKKNYIIVQYMCMKTIPKSNSILKPDLLNVKKIENIEPRLSSIQLTALMKVYLCTFL